MDSVSCEPAIWDRRGIGWHEAVCQDRRRTHRRCCFLHGTPRHSCTSHPDQDTALFLHAPTTHVSILLQYSDDGDTMLKHFTQLCSIKQKHTIYAFERYSMLYIINCYCSENKFWLIDWIYTEINTNKSMHSEMSPVWQNPIQRTVRTAHQGSKFSCSECTTKRVNRIQLHTLSVVFYLNTNISKFVATP